MALIHNKMKKGFTLVEIIVVFAFVAIISLILANIIIRYTGFYNRQQAEVSANTDNRLILDDIYSVARQSVSVVNSIIVSGQTFTTSTNTLIVKLPSVNSAGEPITNTFDHFIFYQDASDQKLFRRRIVPDALSFRPAAFSVLTSNLQTIAFSYDNVDPQLATVITAAITTTKTEGGETKTAQDTIQTRLRNQ